MTKITVKQTSPFPLENNHRVFYVRKHYYILEIYNHSSDRTTYLRFPTRKEASAAMKAYSECLKVHVIGYHDLRIVRHENVHVYVYNLIHHNIPSDDVENIQCLVGHAAWHHTDGEKEKWDRNTRYAIVRTALTRLKRRPVDLGYFACPPKREDIISLYIRST